MIRSLLIGCLLVASASAETKAEAALRIELAAAKVALATAQKEKADLAASIAKLSKTQAASSKSAAVSRQDAANNQADAASQADQNNTTAVQTAASNLADTKKTVVDASALTLAAAESAKSQNTALLIVQVSGLLVTLFTIGGKILSDNAIRVQEHRWKDEDRDKLEKLLATQHQEQVAKIGEVKTEAHNAYNEANTVNKKLETIGVQMRDGEPLKPHPES